MGTYEQSDATQKGHVYVYFLRLGIMITLHLWSDTIGQVYRTRGHAWTKVLKLLYLSLFSTLLSSTTLNKINEYCNQLIADREIVP